MCTYRNRILKNLEESDLDHSGCMGDSPDFNPNVVTKRCLLTCHAIFSIKLCDTQVKAIFGTNATFGPELHS